MIRGSKAITPEIVKFMSYYMPLKKVGKNWVGICPAHSENTSSFVISPSKQLYHCFGCGESGDVWDFLNKHVNLSENGGR